MSKWKAHFTLGALKQLQGLDKEVRIRLVSKLEWTAEHFDSVSLETLKADFSGFYKLRVGDYRAVYDIDWKTSNIIVVEVGHRSKIYRKRR